MRTPKHALVACVLLAVAACGVPTPDKSGVSNANSVPAPQAAALPAQQSMSFGNEYRFTEGVTVSVSKPKSFRPSGNAYPRTDRAAAFEITIRNDSGEPYRLSGFSVSATIDGAQAKQVVDSLQGYNGIVDASKDVQPEGSVRLNLAFAVPNDPVELRLTLRPTATSSVIAVYCGSV